MRTILQKILLLISLTIFLGTAVYAEESNSDQVNNILNMVKKQKPTTQEDTESTQTSAERMKIIEYQREQRIMEDQREQRKYDYQREQRKMNSDANRLNVQIVAFLYAFALVIIIVLMWITDHHAKDIVTIVGLVSVIFGTLLLVLMIGDTEQMTAPIGIFGAIAGYLFGAVQKKEDPKEDPKKENPKEAT